MDYRIFNIHACVIFFACEYTRRTLVYILVRRISIRSAQNVTENVTENVNIDAGAKPNT